jgi:uncharacterized membrane protein
MGITSTAYKIVLLLHILCAIVGFGTVFLNGLYGAQAKRRPGPGGLAIQEANLFVSKIAEYFIYAVFILGIGLVSMSDEAWKFSQTWIWLAMLLYIVGIGVSHGVLFPNAKKLRDLSAELVAVGPPPADAPPGPPPQVAEMERRGKTLGAASTFLHLLLVAILVLMIWKPGA